MVLRNSVIVIGALGYGIVINQARWGCELNLAWAPTQEEQVCRKVSWKEEAPWLAGSMNAGIDSVY